MKTQVLVAAVATSLLAGAFLWWSGSEREEQRAAQLGAGAVLAESAPIRAEKAAPAPEPEAPAEREAVERTPPSTPARSEAPAEPAPWTVRARVLDAEARPLGGIAIGISGTHTVLGTSGSGGWCVFDTRADGLVLEGKDEHWVTVRAGSVKRSTSFDPILVLAPAIDVAGSVQSSSGAALTEASLRFDLPPGFDARFGDVLDATRALAWSTRTDSEGRFRLARIPAVDGSCLRAAAPGYESAVLTRLMESRDDVEFVLARPSLPLAGVLRGTVVDAAGQRVSGARAGLGLTSALSDEEGEFELDLRRAVTAQTLTVVRAGSLPVRMERPGEPDERSTGWPDRVWVVLAGEALAIRGVVLDDGGEPVAHARLWLSDGTPAAPVGHYPIQLEGLMAGAPVPAHAIESEGELPAADGDDDWHTMALVDGEPSAFWNWVETDEHGAFGFAGLEERSYHFEVWRPEALEIVTSDAIRAGTMDASIRLPSPQRLATVSGRVVSRSGVGLAGVQVQESRLLYDVAARTFGGRSRVSRVRHGATTVTDEHGAFTFHDLPAHGVQLAARSDDVVPTVVDVDSAEVEIRVELRCHFEVVLRPPLERYDVLALADEAGERVNVLILTDGNMYALTEVGLHDGRSGVVSASDRARQLLLYKNGALAKSVPIDLAPGEVNRFEF